MRGSFPNRLTIRVAALGLLICGVLVPEAAGHWREGYDWQSNFLSELGATGSRTAAVANFLGFLPVACLGAALALGARPRGGRLARAGNLLLGFGVFAGYGAAFLFPCDPGCPAEGSARQSVHNFGGLVEYVAVILGLVLLCLGLFGRASRRVFAAVVCATLAVLLGFVMMLSPDQIGFRGMWQRLADYSMFAVLILLALRTPAGAR